MAYIVQVTDLRGVVIFKEWHRRNAWGKEKQMLVYLMAHIADLEEASLSIRAFAAIFLFSSLPDALNRHDPEGGRGTADLRYKRPLPWRAPDLPQVPWGPTQDTARRTPRPLRPPALVAETRDFSSRDHRPEVDPFE